MESGINSAVSKSPMALGKRVREYRGSGQKLCTLWKEQQPNTEAFGPKGYIRLFYFVQAAAMSQAGSGAFLTTAGTVEEFRDHFRAVVQYRGIQSQNTI